MLGSLGQMWRMPKKEQALPNSKELELSQYDAEESAHAPAPPPAPQDTDTKRNFFSKVKSRVSGRTLFFTVGGILGLLFSVFFVLAYIRTGGHFQRYLDHVRVTRRDLRRFEAMPAEVHSVDDSGFSLTSTPLIKLPPAMKVEAFSMNVMDFEDRIIARVQVPAYDSATKNLTLRIDFDREDYGTLHRFVRRLSFGGKLMAKVDANITAKTLGISSHGRLERVLHMPHRRFKHRDTPKPRRPSIDPAEALELTELFAAHVLSPTGLMIVMKRPTPNLRADLGHIRFGMFLGNKRLIDLSTQATINPFETDFMVRQGAYSPDAIEHVNATVHGLLKALRQRHPQKEIPRQLLHTVKMPLHIIGEHSQSVAWLNVIVRSLRRTIPVPLEVLESWLIRSGVPQSSFEVAKMDTSVVNAMPRPGDTPATPAPSPALV
ncbi:hypothetical protein BCR37DRAFT_261299 [Protomyces lactucae-debilis]|uniref:Uncharacterized protein n=1 Tax=Protomyces lactucae-debilis TaxID=2754530 RepID=A0A1Y2FNE4_PROLT|nr:uncharacterized protein BCR37DRAFT_261299 [Protomyces lactucae-debilis]ORY84245.1 hypothetical protein BCR37DRAFT_261299 [Protomyces lactucae-debilis]